MGSNPKKKRGRGPLAAHGALLLIGGIAYLAALFGRDAMIMDYGIRQVRRIHTLLLLLLAVLAVTFIAHVLLRVTRARSDRQKRAREDALRQEVRERSREERARERAKLSVDEKLSGDYLRDQVLRHSEGDWGTRRNTQLKPKLAEICRQMDEMDLYQQKLDHLLTSNGMNALDDAQETLEQVEQYILRNARKLVNCMDVYDPASGEEAGRLDASLDDILADNTKQLRNVKEFLFAMTDYINRQGEDDSDIQKLNIYKTAILNSMKEG